MPHSRTRALLALALAALPGGCCGAASDIQKSMAGPDDATLQRLVQERVSRDTALGKQICGVDVAALKDVVVRKTSDGRVQIEATPEVVRPPAPASASASAQGRPPVAPGKALRCAAELKLFWYHEDRKAGERWKISGLEVEAVTTPGVEFTRRTGHHHG